MFVFLAVITIVAIGEDSNWKFNSGPSVTPVCQQQNPCLERRRNILN